MEIARKGSIKLFSLKDLLWFVPLFLLTWDLPVIFIPILGIIIVCKAEWLKYKRRRPPIRFLSYNKTPSKEIKMKTKKIERGIESALKQSFTTCRWACPDGLEKIVASCKQPENIKILVFVDKQTVFKKVYNVTKGDFIETENKHEKGWRKDVATKWFEDHQMIIDAVIDAGIQQEADFIFLPTDISVPASLEQEISSILRQQTNGKVALKEKSNRLCLVFDPKN